MPELFNIIQFPLYWAACISVDMKSLKSSVPAVLKVFSKSSAIWQNDKCSDDLQKYLILKKHKVLQLTELFFYITGSHCWKIWKIQIILSANVLKFAVLTFNICVSVIYQFINVHYNMKFMTSDNSSSYSAKFNIMYK